MANWLAMANGKTVTVSGFGISEDLVKQYRAKYLVLTYGRQAQDDVPGDRA